MMSQEESDNKPSTNHPLSKKKSTTEQKSKDSPGLLSVIQSVLAAMFGVQSEEKRVKDFENGSAINYIVVGVVMVVIFIFSLIAIVNAILENSALK